MVTNSNESLNHNGNRHGNRRGVHPNSQKNLEAGRKKLAELHKNGLGVKHGDYSIMRIVKEMLDQPADERWLHIEDKGKGITWRQAIAKALLVGALRGLPTATTQLFDRLEGKVGEKLDVTTKGEAIGSEHQPIPEQTFRDALVILARAGVSPN